MQNHLASLQDYQTSCYSYCLYTIDLEIIQPPVDFHNVTFDESTSSVQLMCSLNADIPPGVTVRWLFNSIRVLSNELISTAGNTTTLVIGNPQPSDTGAYQCNFAEMNIPLLQRFINLG